MLESIEGAGRHFQARHGDPDSWSVPAALMGLIGHIDYPLFILDALRRVVCANPQGWHVLVSGAVFELRDGAVAVGDADQRVGWLGALRDCHHGHRRLIFLGGRDDAMPVAVSRLSLDDADRMATLVVLGRTTPCEPASLSAFAKFHGMTAAESRVVAGLLGGAGPAGIAQAHGVSISTIRTQIRNLLQKSASGSVRALLLKLCALPPVPPHSFGAGSAITRPMAAA